MFFLTSLSDRVTTSVQVFERYKDHVILRVATSQKNLKKKPEEGWLKKAGVGQPKYCNNAYFHVVLTNLCNIFSIFKVFWSGHDLF